MIEVDEADMRFGGRFLAVEQAVESLCQRRSRFTFDALNPLQETPIVDRQKMDEFLFGRTLLKRLQEFIQERIGGPPLPRRRPIEIHADDQAIVHLMLQNALRGIVDAKPEAGGKVLKQRGFPVASVAAQDDEPNFSLQNNVVVQFIFKRSFNVGFLGKVRVEAPSFAISPARTGIGSQQVPQMRHFVFTASGRFGNLASGFIGPLGLTGRRWNQSSLCFSRRRKSLVRIRMRRLLQKGGDGGVLFALDALPIQAAFLGPAAVVHKRLFLEKHLKEAGGQREEVVRGRGQAACERHIRAIQDGAGRGDRLPHLRYAVVVRQNDLAIGNDQVTRADVAMHQAVAMQNVQRITNRSQPTQR